MTDFEAEIIFNLERWLHDQTGIELDYWALAGIILCLPRLMRFLVMVVAHSFYQQS